MNLLIVSFNIIFIGIGATLLIDLCAVLLKKLFNIPTLNYALMGRWILIFLRFGKLKHQNIQQAPLQNFEHAFGWVIHYLIGIIFALCFILMVGITWLSQPNLFPAICFGITTVFFPFFIMQPCLGMGLFTSKMAEPWKARLKSLLTHTLFGIGLFLSALIYQYLLI
ncbi:DUF2938 domain-containing protein [Acinetobacter defluvii]|uniref:DUF2938 domain-containing protein n=1 Tax=Acinetobacter defluvii TaxID=1871111 RepID=UPI003AF8DC45